jgi:hypothetical protein
MGYALPGDEVRHQFVPVEKDLDPLKALAKSVAEAIKTAVA